MKEYADPVIDWLDAGQGILTRRFFREVCTSTLLEACLGLIRVNTVLYPIAKWVLHQGSYRHRTGPWANLPRRQFTDLLYQKPE